MNMTAADDGTVDSARCQMLLKKLLQQLLDCVNYNVTDVVAYNVEHAILWVRCMCLLLHRFLFKTGERTTEERTPEERTTRESTTERTTHGLYKDYSAPTSARRTFASAIFYLCSISLETGSCRRRLTRQILHILCLKSCIFFFHKGSTRSGKDSVVQMRSRPL